MSPIRAGPGRPKHRTITSPPERYRRPVSSTRRKSRDERSVSSSGSEALATFLTPRLQYRAACSITHSVAEAVSPLPSPHLRLIRSFHGKTDWLGVGPAQVMARSSTMQSVFDPEEPRSDRSAKKWSNPRKDPKKHFAGLEACSRMGKIGIPTSYLELFCGNVWGVLSPTVILAFLTSRR